uniref:Uncharacterized protein n=1 Tax=Anguilla anguilla TaxID=7936 RepID=A0A0E9R7W3_ANGAN
MKSLVILFVMHAQIAFLSFFLKYDGHCKTSIALNVY